MYWYKKALHKSLIAAAIMLLSVSCSDKIEQVPSFKEAQINIPAFFNKEIADLKVINPKVSKTVMKDTISETQELQINNWETELASFVAVDINKPAYAGYLKKDSSDFNVTYTATNPTLEIQFVQIKYDASGKPLTFLIEKNIDNLLYRSAEKLIYTTGKNYRLEKKQHVLLLGDKYYQIAGDIIAN